MQNIWFKKPLQNTTKICLICGQKTYCLHYGILSCKSCKSSFRRILLSEKRFACSKPSLDNINHVLKCRACRFDRSLLLGMNPQALKLPEFIDRDAIVGEFMGRKDFLLEKYKDQKIILPKTCPVVEETLGVKQLHFLLLTESRIKKLRESNACLPAMEENWTIEKLILAPNNVLACAENHTKPANWPLTSKDEICNQWDSSKNPYYLNLLILLNVELAKTLPVFHQLTFNSQISVTNAKKTFSIVMNPLKRVGLSGEEYVLLKAILFSSSVPDYVDSKDKILLEKESQRYSKILLHHLQTKYGTLAGAKKFADVLFLVSCISTSTENVKEHQAFIRYLLHIETNYAPYVNAVLFN